MSAGGDRFDVNGDRLEKIRDWLWGNGLGTIQVTGRFPYGAKQTCPVLTDSVEKFPRQILLAMFDRAGICARINDSFCGF